MARPPKSDRQLADNGLFPDTLNAADAFGYIQKQLDDLDFARQRLSDIHQKLSLMNTEALDGFVIEPTNHMRVCTGLKLTLKL